MLLGGKGKWISYCLTWTRTTLPLSGLLGLKGVSGYGLANKSRGLTRSTWNPSVSNDRFETIQTKYRKPALHFFTETVNVFAVFLQRVGSARLDVASPRYDRP